MITSTKLFPRSGALIERSIIIPHEYYNTVIKYMAKAHIYCLEQQSMSSYTVDIPDTDINDSNMFLLDEIYDRVNHMLLVYFN